MWLLKSSSLITSPNLYNLKSNGEWNYNVIEKEWTKVVKLFNTTDIVISRKLIIYKRIHGFLYKVRL